MPPTFAVDPAGNLAPSAIGTALAQFLGGPPGFSPLTQAAIANFQQQTLPVIQQQFQLQGLGRSPALGQAVGSSLTQALVPFIQTDLANRLQAIQLAQQGLGLSQSAAQAAAQIAAAERAGQLTGLGQAGQLALGGANALATLGQQHLARQQAALQAFGSAGQAQRAAAQDPLDALRQEFLRRQALAEAGTIGLFGGSVIPPTIQGETISRTTGSGGK